MSAIVIKIGGSLFTQPNMVPRLIAKISRLSSQNSADHLVLVTGGGSFVESLREIDRVNDVSREAAHWMAIHLMGLNSDLLQEWWPGLKSVGSLDELYICCNQPGVTLFRVEEFLRNDEPLLLGTQLPVGWEVTSDSIAARVAEIMNAKQLVLLKPLISNATQKWSSTIEFGLVDQFFSQIACRLEEVVLDVL